MRWNLYGFWECTNEKTPRFREGFLSGRGGEIRTRDTRFWRPVLYQLSYAPKLRLTLCLL